MGAPTLRDGDYPFIDQTYPLSDMAFIEAPADLEAMFKRQAEVNGTAILRDEPVELRCVSEAAEATFMIFWPHGTERIHVLVPRKFATGRA